MSAGGGGVGPANAAVAPVDRSKRKKKAGKVVVNLANCKYDVLRTCVRQRKWRFIEDEESVDWNLYWTDTAVSVERVMRMAAHQKMNHFPMMSTLARKAALGRTLNRMLPHFPKDYKIFPRTWSLPSEWTDFAAQFTDGRSTKTFILKPDMVRGGV